MSANTTDADEFYWTCIEEAFDEVDIAAGAEAFSEALHKLPEWVGDLLCVRWLLAEFLNGGLVQFFINSTGILAPEAVSGLNEYAKEHADETTA